MPVVTTEPQPLMHHREQLKKRGITMRDLSRRSGVPYTSISAILNGRLVQPANIKKIEEVIDAEPEPITREEFHQEIRETLCARPGKKITLTKA